jgi:hypothetical protein
MIYDKLSRRHFLQGTGGIAASLPFMTSLMSTAEAASLPPQRFMVSYWLPHGGMAGENVFPINATVSAGLQSQQLYPGHLAQFGSLLDLKRTHAQTTAARKQAIADLDAGAARVSPLVGSFVPDAILAKMNLVQGIDMLFAGGHTRGIFGNFANRDGGPLPGMGGMVPTIDAVIGGAPSFYSAADAATRKVRSLEIGATGLSSYLSGGTVGHNPSVAGSVGELYDRLFSGVQTQAGKTNPDAALVDLIHADYSRLAKGAFGPGRRIGTDDRARLGEYMQNLSDISTRMRALPSQGCTLPTVASADRNKHGYDGAWETNWQPTPELRAADQIAIQHLYNLILVQSFLCGTTRLVTMTVPSLKEIWDPSKFPTGCQFDCQLTDAHHALFHIHLEAGRQQYIVESQRFFFEHAFVDLANRLNSAELVPGVPLLDLSVLHWNSESGIYTHNAVSLPTILAGGAGGFFKTGQYVDYRETRIVTGEYGTEPWNPGLPLNRLLGTLCQAMGVPPSEYELSDATFSTKFPNRGGKVPGYGDPYRFERNRTANNSGIVNVYSDATINDMSLPLPVIKA